MIKTYKKQQFIEKISDNCCLYKASKDGSYYSMYEYTAMNQCDEYNFKVMKKLITCTHVMGVIQRLDHNQHTYFITEHFQSNLLKEQLNQPNQIFQITKALEWFSKIVQIIEEIHQNNVIYRNIRVENFYCQKNNLYIADFAFSQIVRRRQRYFEVVGAPNYFPPEFFSEDGFGYQIDIWAAGVCLYFMLTGEYPFNLQNKNDEQVLQEIQKKCKKGFSFVANASQTKKAKYMQQSKLMQGLFRRIFELDYFQRITVQQLKAHQTIKHYFKVDTGKNDKEIMGTIEQQSAEYHGSIFMSMLAKYPSSYEFHKEQVILDFLQHSSQVLVLGSPESATDELKSLINFSILKIAVMKATHLINVLYGKRQPQFKVDPKQWEQIRKTSAFAKIRQKIGRKKKILDMLFRASLLNVQNYKETSSFYSDNIPSEFSSIKHEFRNNLSRMFQIEKQIMKKKQNKPKVRKVCENLSRLTILCLINRIFLQPGVRQNFQHYFKWSRKQSLQDLQEWIENQKISNLKQFIKSITAKYIE